MGYWRSATIRGRGWLYMTIHMVKRIRSRAQKACDLSKPYVTVTMPAVEYRAEPVFRARRFDWPAVGQLERQFARESGYDANVPVFGNCGDIWLVQPNGRIRGSYTLVCGVAEVSPCASGGGIVRWLWVHPNERGLPANTRRSKRISRGELLWKRLLEEYGQLTLEPPVSGAMARFAEKNGSGSAAAAKHPAG